MGGGRSRQDFLKDIKYAEVCSNTNPPEHVKPTQQPEPKEIPLEEASSLSNDKDKEDSREDMEISLGMEDS